MTIHYTLEENDFITYQLYVASVSKRMQAKRSRSKVRVSLIYLAGGLWLAVLGVLVMGTVFMTAAVGWFFLYPIWERRHYLRHYTAYVKEHFAPRVGKEISLEITDDFMYTKTATSESKVHTSEIEQLTEIPTLFILQLKGGQAFLLPKYKMADREAVSARLKSLAGHLGVEYVGVDKWEWK
ncbi:MULTISPECIES: YcxB family protein [unclassified Flavobacterium]|uniref:YcxB family protein n=1 Tax=unclassified Flavobacterium TaxID=196869 RepID=UPI001F140C79|nr:MULTISPECIES: YcxB family protein [unclassified Flavobacterium]UMY65369.1 YcxB family protein [Flavobacterium sp. HJ-32-4]